VLLDERSRLVGRTVVDEQNLQFAIGLPQNRLDRLAQTVRPVECRHDDADQASHDGSPKEKGRAAERRGARQAILDFILPLL
jgi:hypothetical protein